MCFSPQRRTIFRHLNFQKCSEDYSFLTFWLPNVLFAAAAYHFSTSELQKVLRNWRPLYIFTSQCAFRHSGVPFFDSWTSKSAPSTSCFVHFHVQMCFSPQRRAIFRHLNFKKCSEHLMFCTFSRPNVLFATAACNFWFIRWPHDSAPAALTGLLFDWPDTQILEKTQHFATSLTFGADVSSFFWLSRYCIFFLPTGLLVSSAFQLSILSEVCYLNFLRLQKLIWWYMKKSISQGKLAAHGLSTQNLLTLHGERNACTSTRCSTALEKKTIITVYKFLNTNPVVGYLMVPPSFLVQEKKHQRLNELRSSHEQRPWELRSAVQRHTQRKGLALERLKRFLRRSETTLPETNIAR